jgi:hypothetical protein
MIELPAAWWKSADYDSEVGTYFTVIIPKLHTQALFELLQQPNVQKSQKVYVKLGPPKRPRTTGYRSCNTHIHGHAQQIGEFTGDYKEDVIAEAKRRAVTRGYPTRQNSFGYIVPISEKDASTVEANMIIEELHMIASDIDLALKEYDDGK